MNTTDRIHCLSRLVAAIIQNPNLDPNKNDPIQAACGILTNIEAEVEKMESGNEPIPYSTSIQ